MVAVDLQDQHLKVTWRKEREVQLRVSSSISSSHLTAPWKRSKLVREPLRLLSQVRSRSDQDLLSKVKVVNRYLVARLLANPDSLRITLRQLSSLPVRSKPLVNRVSRSKELRQLRPTLRSKSSWLEKSCLKLKWRKLRKRWKEKMKKSVPCS